MGSPSPPSHMAPCPPALTEPPSTGPGFFQDPEGGQISPPLCRCGQRSRLQSSWNDACFWKHFLCPYLGWLLAGGLLLRTGRSWPQPRSCQGVSAIALPPGWCGWPSFTQSYVSLSQLELRAVHCGLFLSCNTSQQRGHCAAACREGCLNICYLNFLSLRAQKPHPPGTLGSAFHIPDSE